MDQEDNAQLQSNDRDGVNAKEQGSQKKYRVHNDNMKTFMIKIMIINVLQTLFNGLRYQFYLNNIKIKERLELSLLILLFYPIMIVLFRCYRKSTKFKNSLCLYSFFILFFISFVPFPSQFYQVFQDFDQLSYQINYLMLAIINLIVAYPMNIVYLYFTNYLMERNFQIIQYIVAFLVAIIYLIIFLPKCHEAGSTICSMYQSVISILYFQGIMTLYLLIQIQLLFETLEGKHKLQPNQIIYGYMQIQTRSFLYCFKD
ncbi:unnamed protein product [Paramecium octaurelia]|uniref:Transmembrane protein n=1 Tax=Paramecium octaurelia TaxID=43137 RepID=A0A8S1TLY8_PAROT|nr:unnamed protein product [Paramecium octaurelia]